MPTDTNLEVDTGDDLDFNFDLPLEQDQKEQPVDQLDQAVRDAFDDKVQGRKQHLLQNRHFR